MICSREQVVASRRSIDGGPGWPDLLRRGIQFKEHAACRTVLPFKYCPIVARRLHHRDAADRNWFLALPFARPWYVHRALPRLRQVMASRLHTRLYHGFNFVLALRTSAPGFKQPSTRFSMS